jgi:hypothetical protein
MDAKDRASVDSQATTIPSLDASRHLDQGVADEDEDVYTSGIKMKDLGDIEVNHFPGLKREQWW